MARSLDWKSLQFLKGLGVKHFRSAMYHPATNGAVERFVKTLKTALKTEFIEGRESRNVLGRFLFKYRTTPHAVTESTPSELFLGHNLRTTFDLLRPEQRNKVEEKQGKQKQYHDPGKRDVEFQIQDKVMVCIYRRGIIKWEGVL
uniref:Integrase catalytic domain-containing protein n=1 Tax=Amphimedon queenslandica TaxID=400682 RepID=A0A1X7UET5_AMPQE